MNTTVSKGSLKTRTEVPPSQQGRCPQSHRAEHAFALVLPTLLLFPSRLLPPHRAQAPWQHREQTTQPAPPCRGPRSFPRRLRCVPWPVCPGLARPAELGAQRRDHITGSGSGSGSARPPTPSLFAKLLSLTCTGSRKAVIS